MELLVLETENNRYGFSVYEVGTVFSGVSGVYVLLASSDPYATAHTSKGEGVDSSLIGSFEVLYIGIASSFKHRFYHHPTYLRALEQGVSHIGILKISSGRKRRKIEKELVDFFEPGLNRYLKAPL